MLPGKISTRLPHLLAEKYGTNILLFYIIQLIHRVRPRFDIPTANDCGNMMKNSNKQLSLAKCFSSAQVNLHASLLSCFTPFMFHSFHASLLSCLTPFMPHSFHASPKCLTPFMPHSFHVSLLSCFTPFMPLLNASLLSCLTPFMLHSFHASLLLCFTPFIPYSVSFLVTCPPVTFKL